MSHPHHLEEDAMPADFSQVRNLSRDLRAVGPAGIKQSRVAIRKACEDTKRDAKILAPVDTGNLRASIGYETHETKSGAWGVVGPTASYGIFVELGTSRMSGQPFLGPAFDRNAPLLEQALDGLGELP
jgi:HK97 gp10 family phage protein